MSYEIYALRYAEVSGMRSQFFHCHHMHESGDGPQGVDFYFWVVRDADTTLLVDCGFDLDRGAGRDRHQHTDPVELLARVGVRPEDVDHVVVSHLHYDHVGNLGLFPNATVTMARKEHEYWTRPGTLGRALNAHVVDEEDLTEIAAIRDAGRLNLVDGTAEVVPGVTVSVVGGHTPGELIAEIATDGGAVILAADAAHFAEEFEAHRPFCLFHDLDDLYACYDLLHDRAQEPGTVVVPGHDPRTAIEFVQVHENCFDLTAPV